MAIAYGLEETTESESESDDPFESKSDCASENEDSGQYPINIHDVPDIICMVIPSCLVKQ